MVLHNYWTIECIQQQKNRLNKKPSVLSNKEVMDEEEIHTNKILNPVNYIKANLNEITRNCKDLDSEQQAKLSIMLKQHEALFQRKQGEWKDWPVSIKIMEGMTPIWGQTLSSIFEES